MPFLREFANEAVILLMIHVYFHIGASEDCEKALRQALVDVEHGKPCVYVGDHGLKYIGWHFPLNQRQQASAAFARLGADLEEFWKSPTTPSDARCECSNVPCLTKQQMSKLVDLSVEQTLQDTLTLTPSIRKLCCALQRSIFLLAYASRGKIFHELALPDIEYHIEMQNWLGLSQLLDQTEWCRRYQDLCTEQMRSILDGCVGNGAQRGSRNKRQLNGKSNATCLATTCREGPSSTSTVKPTVTTDSIQSTARFVNVKSYVPSLASMETSPVTTKNNCGDGSEHLQFPQGLSSTQTTNVQRMGSFSASGASFLVNVKNSASSQISLVESSVNPPINRVSPSYQNITTRTSYIQMSDVQKITHLSTSAGTFFFTVEPSIIHSSVGSFLYTLIDHRSPSTNSQVTPRPSPLQMPLVFSPSTSAGAMLTTGFIANLSSSTKSLIKVSLFSLRSVLSATGSSQGFVYGLSTATPTDSVRRRVLKSPGVRETNFEEASIGWPSSLAQSSLTERRVELFSIFASKSLRHQSSPETRTTVFLTFRQGKQTAFRVSHSVIRTIMTSSLNFPLPATTVPKRSVTSSSPGIQIKTRINISGVLWPNSQSSPPTIHVMYKDRSLGIKYESENQKTPSTVLVGISASATPLLEEMSLYWTKASLRMSSYDKKSTIYSSLGFKPLAERSAFASKMSSSGPKLSGGVSLGQLVSTASSLAGDVPSKALKTSGKVAEGLSTLITSRGQSSSPTQITVEFTTETRQASLFGSSLLELSHTSFLSLFETENAWWRSRTPQQTTLYHSNAVSRTGITLSALSRTLAPSGGLSRGQVSLTPTCTSVVMKSNGSYSSHGTIQSEEMSSTMSLKYSKTAKMVHGVGLSSLITPTESAPPSLQRSSTLRMLLYRSPPIISKSSTRWVEKSVMASSSRSSSIRNDQSISSAVRLDDDASSGKLPATTQIFSSSSSSPFPDSQLLIRTTSFRMSSCSSSSCRSKDSPRMASVIFNRTDIFSRQLAGKSLRSGFFTSPFVSSRSRVLFNTDETSEAQGISPILSASVTESTSLFTTVFSSTNLGKTTKVFDTRKTLSNVWGSNATETLSIRPWNRSIEVHVTSPISSNLTTESSSHYSLILMGKPGTNSPRVSQTPYTQSSVGLGMSATEVSYSRTWNTISWDPSLSPPPSEVASQASSVLLQLTRGTKMAPSTGSFYETTSSSAAVIEASPLRSSLSSATKLNSTNVGSGVSFTKRTPERLTSAIHSQTASQRTVSTLDHLFTKLLPSTVTRISVQLLTQSMVKGEAGSPMLPSSFNELFPTVPVLSSSPSAFESSSLVRATPLPSVAIASTSRFSSSELASASSALSPTKYDQTYLVILSGNCDMLDNRDDFSTLFKSVLARLLSLYATDVSVRRISCGSVHVVFSVRDAKRRNITNKLEDLIGKKTFKFEYSNMTFIAEQLSVVLKPSKTTTSRPSRTTRTSIPREKQIALIIFILFLSLFATASVLLTVIFCARFGCCQRREKRRKRRKKTTPAEVELKVFSSLYSNLLRKVDYYGGSPQLTSPKKETREKPEEGEWDGDEDGPGTVTALLSKAQKVGDSEEKRFTFHDDDSCSSVLFY